MSFHQFRIVIFSRKWIALWVMVITVITTLIVSLLIPKQYIATTSLVVEQRSIDAVTGQIMPVQLLPSYIATQVDVISSRNVARKVLEELTPSVFKLSEYSQLKKNFEKAGSNGDIKDWAAVQLLKKLTVRPSHESNLIQIDFTSSDPKMASDIANAFAGAYIKTSIELRAQPAKLTADWLASQMASLRENLENAHSVLSTYQQQQGIVEGSERLNIDRLVDIEQTRLFDLSKQLVESQARTSELQSRKDLLTSTLKNGGSFESLQEVLNSPLIQSLKSELAKSSAHFAELSQKFKKGNSQYKQAEAQMVSLQMEIKSATKMVLTSINSAVASSKSRDEMLSKALAEQKSKVMDLKQKHDQIAVLNREVENAQRAYDEVMHRTVQTRMESEMSQTGVSILNPAFPPPKHSMPNLFINTILSFFVGSLLGVVSALLAEMMDRRVRSLLDASDALAIPIFAVISITKAKPKRKARLFNFIKTSCSFR